ncbi:MAG: von Willebrand factor type A domain-containing protein [Saccharospirillaceae bacterium]|nr:von Willebrand factor type A domain-containing protein [Pseudomonadales bacterium]NRB80560.1 von Willebrand factor type A domain-containing protein [Saccharospirillaceae bacterium]
MKKPFQLTILALSILSAGVLLTNCAADQSQEVKSNKTASLHSPGALAGTIVEQQTEMDMMSMEQIAPVEKIRSRESSLSSVQSSSVQHSSIAIVAKRHSVKPYIPEPIITDQVNINIAQNPEQNLKLTKDEPVSTFSVDVDTASFSQIKQYLDLGKLPPKELVRSEEVINYFDYAYPNPSSINNPITLNAHLMRHPFKQDTHLLQVGLQAFAVDADELPPMNLVLLIDVSGSMSSQDKLPLLIKGMDILIDQLDEDDRISIVTYAGRAAVLAQGISGDQKSKLRNIIRSLNSGGSTHGSAGIQQAYELAQKFHIPNGVNRVVLATDGDFNVGLTGTDSLKQFVSKKANDKVYLSAIGFGHSGYNDSIMEEISNAGEGNAYFINDYNQARKVFSKQLPSMALSVAADVKVQIEFNPQYVSEYRLIGYNNRRLNREDFNNDKIDAAEMGAGHNVTAIYEVTLVGDKQNVDPLRYQQQKNSVVLKQNPEAEIAFFKVRYKKQLDQSSEKISLAILNKTITNPADNLVLATSAMQFAETLRNELATQNDYQQILDWLDQIKNSNQEVAELRNMIHNARSLTH